MEIIRREVYELKIKNIQNIYQEIAQALIPHREKPVCSVEFIVEGKINAPIISIRYPGRKVKKREPKGKGKLKYEWDNLLDFAVVPYLEGKEISLEEFSFENLSIDFQKNKKDSKEFWECIEEIYHTNQLTKTPPELPGINSKLFLLVLKWIWIQEDLNYKLSWKDVGSPIKYRLITRTGARTEHGAGRAKFFAALILLKHHFTLEEVKKIIPFH